MAVSQLVYNLIAYAFTLLAAVGVGYLTYRVLYVGVQFDSSGLSIYRTPEDKVLDVWRAFVTWMVHFVPSSDTEKMKILGKSKRRYVTERVVFGLGSFAVIMMSMHSILWAIIIGLIGSFLPKLLLMASFEGWRQEIIAGVPTLIDFMSINLTLREHPANSLKETIPQLPPALASEVELIVSTIATTNDYKKALDNFVDRIGDADVTAIVQKLKSAWDTDVYAELFDDVRENLTRLRSLAVINKTQSKKRVLTLLPILGIPGILIIVGPPIVAWIGSTITGL